jgi:hypothetical protein
MVGKITSSDGLGRASLLALFPPSKTFFRLGASFQSDFEFIIQKLEMFELLYYCSEKLEYLSYRNRN